MGGTLPLERETRGLMRQPTLQTQTLTFFIFEQILNSRVISRYILSFQGNESNMQFGNINICTAEELGICV